MWNKLIDVYVQHYQFHLVLLVTGLSEKYHNTMIYMLICLIWVLL